jgi:hypothetical protein
MMQRRTMLIIVLLGFGSITAASATTVTATYTGTVASGFDYGLFAGGGTSLAGEAFTAVFTFDVTNWNFADANGSSQAAGGSEFGSPNSATASLTINGVTQALNMPYFANYEGGLLIPGVSESRYSFETPVVPGQVGSGSLFQGFALIVSAPDASTFPENLLTPFSYTAGPDGIGAGSFQFYTTNGSPTLLSSGDLTPTSETVSVSEVPLPWTLPLLLSALGCGAICRPFRRRADMELAGIGPART